MFEETNQSMETTPTEDTHSYDEKDDLFDYDDDDGNQAESEEEEQIEKEQPAETEEKKEETKSDQQKKPILTVKHLGLEKQLSEDEARTYAQKGMDYDHLKDQFESLKNSEELSTLDQMAKEAGLANRSEYVKALSQFNQNNAVSAYVDKLKQQYPNTDEAVLNELAKVQLAQNKDREQKQHQSQQQQEEKQKKENFQAQFNAFTNEYPKVDVSSLPDDVIQSMATGETMLSAYRAFELKKIKEDYAAAVKNKDNKSKVLGSVKGKDGENMDAFEQGFES